MISSHRIPSIAILWIFIFINQYYDHSASTSLGKGEGVNKKWHRKEGAQSKKWCLSHKFFYALFSVTQTLFLLGFASNPGSITATNKKNTSKEVPTSISEITIIYLHKNIIPPLCHCGMFIQIVSKNSTASEDVIFYLLWYNVISWSSFSLIL